MDVCLSEQHKYATGIRLVRRRNKVNNKGQR
jgi:hypothetical protein